METQALSVTTQYHLRHVIKVCVGGSQRLREACSRLGPIPEIFNYTSLVILQTRSALNIEVIPEVRE